MNRRTRLLIRTFGTKRGDDEKSPALWSYAGLFEVAHPRPSWAS